MSSILAKMAVQISANTAEFNKALAKTNKEINSFTSNVKSAATTLGVAFGAQQIGSFTLEVTKLAGEADGVRRAFLKFNESQKLLQSLKEATAGTVSELDLMKRTVQATNFGISLGSLPKLLEFAAVRAQQTGQSVDYLVDSIVTGIGRKSPLILDNLGISAVALKEKLDGVSIAEASVGQVADAVGKIAGDSLKQMGSLSDTTATKIQKLAADWVNLKVVIGEAIEPFARFSIKFVNDFIDTLRGVKPPMLELALAMDEFNKSQPKGDEFLEQYKDLEKAAEAAGKKLILLTDSATGLRKVMIDPRTPLSKTIEDAIKPAKTLDEIVKSIQDRYDKLNSLARKEFEKPLEAGKLPSSTGSLVNPQLITDQINSVIPALKALPEQMRPIFLEVETMFSDLAASAQGMASIIGDSVGAAFSGAMSGIDILRRATSEIVDLFARQAIAAAIANAAKFGGPFPFAAVALATAAAGAMKGLLNRVGVKSSGGVGGGGVARTSIPNSSSGLAQNSFNNLSLETLIRGQDLYVVLSNYERNNKSTRG